MGGTFCRAFFGGELCEGAPEAQYVCSRCSRLGKPAGILFLDLRKAFDKIVRETLFGCGEINIETHLLGLGLSQAEAKHMAGHIDKSGGLLRETGVPDVIAKLVCLICTMVRGSIPHPLVARL